MKWMFHRNGIPRIQRARPIPRVVFWLIWFELWEPMDWRGFGSICSYWSSSKWHLAKTEQLNASCVGERCIAFCRPGAFDSASDNESTHTAITKIFIFWVARLDSESRICRLADACLMLLHVDRLRIRLLQSTVGLSEKLFGVFTPWLMCLSGLTSALLIISRDFRQLDKHLINAISCLCWAFDVDCLLFCSVLNRFSLSHLSLTR